MGRDLKITTFTISLLSEALKRFCSDVYVAYIRIILRPRLAHLCMGNSLMYIITYLLTVQLYIS